LRRCGLLEEFARNMLRLFEEGGKAVSGLMERPDTKVSPYSAASEMAQATTTINEIANLWMSNPERVAKAQNDLMVSYVELWNNSIRKMMGEPVEPVIEPEPSDNRFKDPDWSDNPYFDFWKQAYLVTTQWSEKMLAGTDGLEGDARKRAEFYFRQVSSALSPSNFPMLNPEVVRTTLATNGSNLVAGMNLLVQDMEKSGDLLKVSQTDTKAFEVGRNLATTPGKVVFQNELLQLIQYTPTTEKVREIPMLVVPPWINKYYVLDLTPAKSLIKYAVDQGFTIFVVSWVNPDASLAAKTFEDYMLEGLLRAVEAVKEETGHAQINVTGYCVGGTLLACTLAYLAARGETPFKSVTFLTTQVDFSQAGDLLLFTSNEQLKNLDQMMAERGYLDGSRMANVFNMMRSRDLIWPYIVSNYMLGKKPFPFDLLYWNQDSTRMCAANHAFYLREFYNENRLAKGEMTLGGVELDLSKVKLPIFHLATKEDHIAPAKSVFIGANMLGSNVEFVLAGSGHIAGVVNPPDKVKYKYWTGGTKRDGSLDDWIASAKPQPGSWWPHWVKWLSAQSGNWTIPRDPGETLGVIEDAPGSYVREKS
jgi:polyhydroxyalkanoate synthase subunit PhaC